MRSVKNELTQLQEILHDRGLPEALKFLNQRVPYRATAVYKFEQGHMRLVHAVDKLDDLTVSALSLVPLGDSFCQFAMRDGQLVTSDTAADKRVDGHRYQGVLASYVGLPLMKSGMLFGTLCHYDFVTHSIEDEEFTFLQSATQELPKYL